MGRIFLPGQRWTSEREPELGLGRVEALGSRTVVVAFPASGECREYGLESAPLRRVAFRVGDLVQSRDGRSFEVQEVQEEQGCLLYVGEGTLHEADLGDAQRTQGPEDRLRQGMSDAPEAFELRVAALRLQHKRRASQVRGFAGGRIDLLPHQLSIAAEVTGRLSPRVLLADEVGLGKTIEAGLILHRLLATGRVGRVLVLVPEPLVHQWFVELLRKFNLWFAIFDAARCATEDGSNPFLEDQLVLASLDLLAGSPERLEQACAGGFDLVVVDEAHHLTWTPEAPSAAYAAVEALGQAAPGLLLLTATPEQLGLTGHFARLRLLDPDRYADFATFQREMEDHREVAALADRLLQEEPLEKSDVAKLSAWIGEDAGPGLQHDREGLLRALVDRHGTGRVMFRNTRATVSGFPRRVARLAPLEVTPKPRGKTGLDTDPRLPWLVELLQSLGDRKVLLICHTRAQVEALEAALKTRLSLKAALFHEGLTLIQRDRAAAWFTEPRGARLLICSEIGSEGRNFQMAHDLVLFDLPQDPGLLEQRIGRLDRIGQTEDIQIHVPYVLGSPQEVLARWYHEGLNAFQSCVHGGRELGEAFGARLDQVAAAKGLKGLDTLLEETRALHADVKARLEAGRDRLLELNSCRPAVAEGLVAEIRAQDEDRSLDTFLLGAFEQAFIPVEELAPRTWSLGSAGVLAESFPGLPEDGLVLTCDRARALVREDLQFLTPDHPLVNGALDLVLGAPAGSTGFARWPDATTRAVYLEAIFVLETVAPPHLHADRFLPPTPLRVLVDASGADQSKAIPRSSYVRHLRADEPRGLLNLVPFREDALPRMLARAHRYASRRIPATVERALTAMASDLDAELQRLEALRQINPAVRETELEQLRAQKTALEDALSGARVRLDAVRVIRRG